MKQLSFLALSPLLLSAGSQAAISFSVTFTADALNDLSAADQAKFTDAVNFWDAIIDDHQDGASRSWDVTVDTFEEAASGGGVRLGSAGPATLGLTAVVPGSGLSAPWTDQFIISTSGQAEFNVHPDAGTLNPLTIRHEIGHALGIGTLWEDNEVYNDGVGGNSNRTLTGGTPGQYTGANALAAYQAEFVPGATFVPIERDGGGGTADGHWNEVLDNFSLENAPGFDSDPGDGGPAPTVAAGFPFEGESQDDELMTGVLSDPAFLSRTTIASLIDIGFTLEPGVFVPEPGSVSLLVGSLLLLGIRRRR